MKGTINHALIMAAGRGARMMPLTAVVPKAMVPYMGGTLIMEGIRKIHASINNVHVTVGYKGALLAEHVIGLGVTSVFNTSGKGNAWWIYHSLLRYLNEPLCVLTCDNIVDLDFELLAMDYLRLGEPACMVVPVEPIDGLQGDYITREGNVVLRLSRSEPSDCYCSGIQVVNPIKINRLTEPCEDFSDVWGQLIHQRRVFCSNIYPKRWFTLDTVEQLKMFS